MSLKKLIAVLLVGSLLAGCTSTTESSKESSGETETNAEVENQESLEFELQGMNATITLLSDFVVVNEEVDPQSKHYTYTYVSADEDLGEGNFYMLINKHSMEEQEEFEEYCLPVKQTKEDVENRFSTIENAPIENNEFEIATNVKGSKYQYASFIESKQKRENEEGYARVDYTLEFVDFNTTDYKYSINATIFVDEGTLKSETVEKANKVMMNIFDSTKFNSKALEKVEE